jgi:hypothetical protein
MGRIERSLSRGALTGLALIGLVLASSGIAVASPRGEGGTAEDAKQEDTQEGTGERLSRGETVVFDQALDRGGRRYVGGTTYTIIEASMPELEGLLLNTRAYRQLLPHTKQARLVGVNGDDFFIELRQGNSLVETSYTIRVRREALPTGPGQTDATRASPVTLAPEGQAHREGTVFRFWLDRSKPHGIEDAWGYFRLERLPEKSSGVPRVLLTYGILVDVGPGLVRDLFEERLRQLALAVPQLVRQYALEHFGFGARVSLNASGEANHRNVD